MDSWFIPFTEHHPLIAVAILLVSLVALLYAICWIDHWLVESTKALIEEAKQECAAKEHYVHIKMHFPEQRCCKYVCSCGQEVTATADNLTEADIKARDLFTLHSTGVSEYEKLLYS